MFEGLSLLPVAAITFGVLFLLFLVLIRWLKVGSFKAFWYLFGTVSALFVVVTALFLWQTRVAAVPGRVKGVWGYSVLTLRADHTSIQEVQFMEYDQPSVPPYKQHSTQHAIVQGRWEERGRDWFHRKLVISSLIGLAPWNQGTMYKDFRCSYGPVMLSGLGIEVDSGADIVYRK